MQKLPTKNKIAICFTERTLENSKVILLQNSRHQKVQTRTKIDGEQFFP